MDYNELVEKLNNIGDKWKELQKKNLYFYNAATAIAALLIRAEAAERERDEALKAICTHCGDFPCRKNECPWWSGQKEE